jgi:hypothetical protein
MVNSKNSLNLKINKNTSTKKSIYSRPQVDGLIRKKVETRSELIKENNFNKEDILKLNNNTDDRLDTNVVDSSIDDSKRLFLKVAGVAGLGLAASALFPKSADAYVAGSTPTSNVVGLKNSTNIRINPATEETLSTLLSGQGVTKLTTSLSSSGVVRTPASGKKIRVYASRFSLTADATSVSFRFTSGGTDHEKYVSPKTGGLYGANNHPNFIEGGVDEVLYCAISGTTTVQINIDYLEV